MELHNKTVITYYLLVPKYPNGKKIDWSLITSMISSDDEIKGLGDISNLNIEIDYPPLKYEEKVDVPNIDKKKIYLRTRLWFHKSFVDDKAVLSIQDFENGILIGNGAFKVFIQENVNNIIDIIGNKSLTGYVKFSIRIYMRDNKYKYIIDGLVHDDVYINQGTTIDAGMGLLTTSKYPPLTGLWVTSGEELLKKLKFYVDVRIKALTESLKNTVIHDTESDF